MLVLAMEFSRDASGAARDPDPKARSPHGSAQTRQAAGAGPRHRLYRLGGLCRFLGDGGVAHGVRKYTI